MARAIVILLITCLVMLSACSGSTALPTSEAQRIADKCISAMAQVHSYKLDTDVVNVYKVIDEPNAGTDTTEWNGTKIVSIAGKKMGMNMTIDESGDYYPEGDNSSTEMYIIDGWEYYKATSPHVVNLSPSPSNPWDKTKLTDELWARETQIPFYTELLKTATESDLLGNATVNGVDCYILRIVPSTQVMIDWVLSQDQPAGRQIDGVRYGGENIVERADAYQSGSVKLWIDKNTSLILQAQVNSVFRGDVSGGILFPSLGTAPNTPTPDLVESSYDGQITFSEYNLPVSIQLPQEASEAQAH